MLLPHRRIQLRALGYLPQRLVTMGDPLLPELLEGVIFNRPLPKDWGKTLYIPLDNWPAVSYLPFTEHDILGQVNEHIGIPTTEAGVRLAEKEMEEESPSLFKTNPPRVVVLIVPTNAHDSLQCAEEGQLTLYQYFHKPTGKLLRPVPTSHLDIEERALHTTVGCPLGHRGIWYCRPDAIEGAPLAVGNIVVFTDGNGVILEVGEVTELIGPQNPTTKKWCSGQNSVGFRWKDALPDVVAGLELLKEKQCP